MLSILVRFSIRYCGIIITLAALILLYGSYRLTVAGLDIFPEFAPKRVIIQSEAPGLSAEQVEVLVTRSLSDNRYECLIFCGAIMQKKQDWACKTTFQITHS